MEFSLSGDLSDWMLDEDAGYIYAISNKANSLYFIRLSDMTIEKTLNVGSNPIYLARDGQSLQIALAGATMIKTVDLTTQQVSDTIITSAVPNSVAASSKYLFYNTGDGIYMYDKANRTNSKLKNNSYLVSGAMAIDEPSNTLYVGGVSSYAGIFALNAETGVELSRDIDDDMEIGGPSLSLKHIFIDEQSVYFGGHQFNKFNLAETTGTYTRTNNDYTYLESVILGVTDSYVLTTQGVYDKATYRPLATFPSNKRFALLDSNGHAYLAGIENWYDNLQTISRVDLAIPQQADTAVLTTTAYSIRSDQAFTDWTTTDSSPYIYAILGSTNELVVIRKDDMSEVKKMFVGSGPKEIEMLNDRIYIIFTGENHINVLNLENGIPSQTATAKITTKHYPLKVYPDRNDRILYNGGVFAEGLSVTSAVYTSVADAVYYEKSTGIRSADNYALDLSGGTLYGADSFNLYTYDSQSFNLIKKSSMESSYSYPNLWLDGNHLYVGNMRLDASNPSIRYGTYPERVVYARGELVFGNGAVYDRDDFTKLIDLSMYIQRAYVDEQGYIFVSNSNRIYKFSNLEDFQVYLNEARLPTNATFIDEDLTSGKIEGYLSFTPPIDQDGLEGYAAYFMDQNGNKLKQIGMYKKQDLSTESQFVYEISQSTLPEGTVSIALYPVVRLDAYGSERTLDIHTSVPVYDAPDYLPVDVAATDMNSDMNKFAGTITWKPGKTEIPNIRYYVYFIDSTGPVGEELAVVDSGKLEYSVAIPETDVPEEVLGIGIFMESGDFDSPFYGYSLFDDKKTPAISPSSIVVHKYMVQADNVEVNNLLPGDIVFIYDENVTVILGWGIVGANQNSLKITIGNIGDPGDKIVVTRQTANRSESEGTLVVIPGVVNDGSGGPGGVGGGPGGIGGGPGGIGGGPGGASGGKVNEPAKIVTTVKENTDGTHSSLTEVTSAFILKAVNDAEFKKNPVLTIKAEEETQMQGSEFKVDLNTLGIMLNASKDAAFVLESGFGKIELPVSDLSSALSQGMGMEPKMIVSMSKAAGDYKTKLNAQLNGVANMAIGDPVEFEVKLTGNGQERVLSNFSKYVGHTINFKTAQDPSAVYTGLTFDPVTQAYVPVPTTWEWKDGVLQVTLQRKGNSVYTVVQNQVSFNDLENNSSYKDSILALAKRMVINGYPDTSFKPGASVTRAEFASMLNRALGILPKLTASKAFTDVKSGVWYETQVNASVDAGLINGYTDGTFRPNQNITHQEMITMLVNALKYGDASAEIKKTSSSAYPEGLPAWAKPYYTLAFERGILSADSPVHFRTGKNTQRQESAYLLYELMKVLKLTNA